MVSNGTEPTILCLAHLGWDFVWQRPQHILSRLSDRYPVIYVNEPHIRNASQPDYPADGQPYLKPVAQDERISAYQPIFPDNPEIIGHWQETYTHVVQRLIGRMRGNGQLSGRAYSDTTRIATPAKTNGATNGAAHGTPVHRPGADGAFPSHRSPLILWFYTPQPYYMADQLDADLIVYDVMDELANFKNGTADLLAREAHLLQKADVVFTGGRSIYEARHGRHPNLHLYPSGVEPEHFAKALRPDLQVAPEISHLQGPVLGYYGVIDERLDIELLRSLAESHPEWSIVMVGPVVKISESDLPRLPNIHYLGKQPYERLPEFLKRFDVCLMPFAMNKATQSISPTKTLEYMAAHKPIVSTPVPDVVATWSDVVRIASDHEKFAAAVENMLKESAADREVRHRREKAHLSRSTWDHITGQMAKNIDQALARHGVGVPVGTQPAAPAPNLRYGARA